MKALTGSGKTVILLDYIDEYLFNARPNTAFVWFCPGSGDLEEQSRDKMRRLLPNRRTQYLFEAMQNGFEAETTTFINWELVRNKNLAIRDGERKNLFDRIADAHRNGTQFILIIDEEHANDTKKAQDIRQIMAQYKAVVPDKIIRPLVLIQFPSGQPRAARNHISGRNKAC